MSCCFPSEEEVEEDSEEGVSPMVLDDARVPLPKSLLYAGPGKASLTAMFDVGVGGMGAPVDMYVCGRCSTADHPIRWDSKSIPYFEPHGICGRNVLVSLAGLDKLNRFNVSNDVVCDFDVFGALTFVHYNMESYIDVVESGIIISKREQHVLVCDFPPLFVDDKPASEEAALFLRISRVTNPRTKETFAPTEDDISAFLGVVELAHDCGKSISAYIRSCTPRLNIPVLVFTGKSLR